MCGWQGDSSGVGVWWQQRGESAGVSARASTSGARDARVAPLLPHKRAREEAGEPESPRAAAEAGVDGAMAARVEAAKVLLAASHAAVPSQVRRSFYSVCRACEGKSLVRA
jgi:hypothetical protein